MNVKDIVLADLVMLNEYGTLRARIKHDYDTAQHKGWIETLHYQESGQTGLFIHDDQRSHWVKLRIHDRDLGRPVPGGICKLELKNECDRFYLPVPEWLEVEENLREVTVAKVDLDWGVEEAPEHVYDDEEDLLREHFGLPEISRR